MTDFSAVTPTQIEATMREFDLNDRSKPPWDRWMQGNYGKHSWAIRWETRLYPLKEILSRASRIPSDDFHTNEARQFLTQLGFEVVQLDRVSPEASSLSWEIREGCLLPEALQAGLKTRHQIMLGEGKLPSEAALAGYYDTFRARFDPDILQNLDGEALLETMHNHSNRDSLVYWLEFKNDEEFPAIFGSIAGGSALKFGIYRRKETGIWTGGTSQNQEALSIEQAIEIARKHRDQLVRGTELLAGLPAGAGAAEYQLLQEQMDKLAPDVSQKAWGHKYFSLLYPDKLDDYHVQDYQRFHLITLLQTPPAGEGRYLAARQFVAIGRELDMPLNHLTSMLNDRNGPLRRYWRIGTQLGGEDSFWETMQAEACVAIGWGDVLGDLSHIEYNRQGRETLRQGMLAHYNPPQLAGRKAQEVFNFVAAIQPGDLVLAGAGATVMGIGQITGEYFFVAGSPAPHRRPVKWLSLEAWSLPKAECRQTTVCQLRKEVENLIEIERQILIAPKVPTTLVQTASIPTPHPVQLEGIPGRIQSILERKRQVILYGPPGTGKTYWAQRTARDLAAYAQFGQAYGALSLEQQDIINGTSHHDGLVQLCAFHPAYGYEDFLEGYRPQATNGELVFEARDGLFKKLCLTAEAQPNRKYFLIIDEINRGDIPRIFGELLTILEKDKREQRILLPLSGKPFQVPDNVYLIGTMNTADRSIALLDTALRRRFGFIELMPDSSLLKDVVIESVPLGPWLDALNQAICACIGRDARNLQIGHAYFLDGDKPVTSFTRFARLIQDDIIPLLEEYCYEDYATLAKILGSGLVDEPGQRIRHEIFLPTKKDALIQALKAIDPNLDTSASAVRSDAEAYDPADEEEMDEDETLESDDEQTDHE